MEYFKFLKDYLKNFLGSAMECLGNLVDVRLTKRSHFKNGEVKGRLRHDNGVITVTM